MLGEDFDLDVKPSFKANYLQVEDVPEIPESLDFLSYQMLIPKGFEEDVSMFLDGDSIVIRCLKPENPEYTDVIIRPSLFNSLAANTVVPRFLFETSTISNTPVNYFGENSDQVLNMNQMLYLLIHHRLSFFRGYNRQFVNLLQQDINNLSNYLEYNLPVAYNAVQKARNTFVIIPASSHTKIYPYGNFLVSCRPSEEDWIQILKDIGKYIQPSSDSAMHKRAKVVLSVKPIYRSVGYAPNKDGSFYSLFECKQNLPARLKTHYLGDAKELRHPDMSCFQQDCLVVKDELTGDYKLIPKDRTGKKGIVVFAPIEWDTKRFIAGEAEVSSNIADTLVINTDSVNVSFVSKLGIRIDHKVGELIKVNKNEEIILGYDDELEPVILPNDVFSYRITKINQSSTAGLSKLHFEAVMRAGNARITSSTGLKFVSKVMTNLGKICLPKRESKTDIKTKFSPTVSRYLKEADEAELSQYKKLEVEDLETDILYPDVIVGMNAVKANTNTQCNTIVLAQATLAVDLGYYVPSEKFGFKGLLDSFDVQEINEAARSLPEFFYIDRFGQRQKVLIGMASLNFTELGSVYTRFKPQSFAFTSGKNIYQNMPELAKHIYDNYLEEDKVEIAKEFYKVLQDNRGRLRTVEKLPRYTPKVIRAKKLFEESDLIMSKTMFSNGEASKLLDEEWNKGFYLDLTAYKKGPLIRIPCAKSLKAFVGKLPDGSYSFHSIIVNISKMIFHIIGNAGNNYNLSIGYLYNPNNVGKKTAYGRTRLSAYDLYMQTMQGALYSNEESAMMIVQSLIKPKINGIGMKQVVESLLPDDVIVITDDRKYRRIIREAGKGGSFEIDLDIVDDLAEEDFDFEVDSLINIAVNDTSSTEAVEEVLNNVPLVLAVRNPSYV